ncbi:unnamed protein product [Pylaiella littoralis]
MVHSFLSETRQGFESVSVSGNTCIYVRYKMCHVPVRGSTTCYTYEMNSESVSVFVCACVRVCVYPVYSWHQSTPASITWGAPQPGSHKRKNTHTGYFSFLDLNPPSAVLAFFALISAFFYREKGCSRPFALVNCCVALRGKNLMPRMTYSEGGEVRKNFCVDHLTQSCTSKYYFRSHTLSRILQSRSTPLPGCLWRFAYTTDDVPAG